MPPLAAHRDETGLRKTVQWYLDHSGWVESVSSGAYQQWLTKNYGSRADLATAGAR